MSTSQLVTQLGQAYSTSLLTGSGFVKTSLSLFTDKLSGAGRMNTFVGRRVVSFVAPLTSVSSIGLDYTSYYVLLLLSILFILSGAAFLFMGSLGAEGVTGFMPFFIIGILLLVAYFSTKQRYIVINVQGCIYRLSLRGISNNELAKFIDMAIQSINTAKGI